MLDNVEGFVLMIKSFIPTRFPKIFFSSLSRINCSEKHLYLSFDDGPNHLLTEDILRILKVYNAKATFFCTGRNAEKYPDLLEKIKEEGHVIGNHGYSHKNAYKVSSKEWIDDMLKESPVSDCRLFRPPYGKILPSQYLKLNRKYKIVFWDVLSKDFLEGFEVEEIVSLVKAKSRKGSIIVFHDNPKFKNKMLPALEEVLKFFSSEGYDFREIITT